jgi:hypothetical protein
MCLKCKEYIPNPLTQFNLIDDDYGIAFELSLFITNIKKEICDVLESFPSFSRTYKKKKTHNMLCLILDPKLKSLHLVFLLLAVKKGEHC